MGRLELVQHGHRRDDEVVARERAIAGQVKCEFHDVKCKERMNHG